jgi:hypothetical protein
MRIRRAPLTRVLLTIGAVGSILAGIGVPIATAVAPAAASVSAASATPDAIGYGW